MKWLYSKTFFYVIGCVAIVALLLAFQTKGWLSPVRYSLGNVIRPVGLVAQRTIAPIKSFFRTIVTLRSVVVENTSLRRELQNLQQQLVEFQQVRNENDNLRKDLGFVKTAPYELQPCTVLAIDPQELAKTFTINCGDRQGIRAGQAVVSNGYLVGKIVYAGPLVSTAVFITNSQSSVDAKISNSSTSGLVKGSYGSGLVFDQVAQNSNLALGELVVTAGISSAMPKNIIIGEIGSVISQPTDLFKRASVISPLNFHSLEYVFVAK